MSTEHIYYIYLYHPIHKIEHWCATKCDCPSTQDVRVADRSQYTNERRVHVAYYVYLYEKSVNSSPQSHISDSNIISSLVMSVLKPDVLHSPLGRDDETGQSFVPHET